MIYLCTSLFFIHLLVVAWGYVSSRGRCLPKQSQEDLLTGRSPSPLVFTSPPFRHSLPLCFPLSSTLPFSVALHHAASSQSNQLDGSFGTESPACVRGRVLAGRGGEWALLWSLHRALKATQVFIRGCRNWSPPFSNRPISQGLSVSWPFH